MLVLDFETRAIVGNPTVRPPTPVGLAYKRPGAPGEYLPWLHPSLSPQAAQRALEQAKTLVSEAIASGEKLLFHNSKFDVSVMEVHWGMHPAPQNVEDTMYQIFLHEPYASTFSLKPSSERILGIPPDEQNALHDWIRTNLHVTAKQAGAYISEAPVELVAPYAVGDVERTYSLFEHLSNKVPTGPYEREKALRPILVAGERRGIRVNVAQLEQDLEKWEQSLMVANHRIYEMLDGKEFNIDSGPELADALDRCGKVETWTMTPTGKRSTARPNLMKCVADPKLANMLAYRGALAYCLGNFARPWVQLCKDSPSGARMHPEWNQVRQMRGEARETVGTRTGRLSCTNPNFQNPPNEYNLDVPEGMPHLPFMRKYILPEEGAIWCKRDYSQQELRILAHYSEGRLYDAYRRDPRIDAHETCQKLIFDLTGRELVRKYVKITGFSMIYGAGYASLAEQLGVERGEAKEIIAAYLIAFPEVRDLMRDCQNRGKSGRGIRTWGGREYTSEPSKIVAGRLWSFDYKLLNYLIQGSAADCTKEAIIRWAANSGSGVFACTVHDEINISAYSVLDIHKLTEAMESIEFDVKMLSDGYTGPNWFDLTKGE